MKRKTKFIYNGLLLSVVGLAMRGTQLLFGAYIARKLGADGVGMNTLVMMVYAFALTFATSGISLTVTRLVATSVGEGREGECSGILKGAFLYATIFGTLSNVGLFLLSGVIGNTFIGETSVVTPLHILSFSLLPSAFTSVISGYFIAQRRVTINAFTQVTGQLLRIAITVLLLTKTKHDAISMLSLGVTVSEIITLVILLPPFIAERRRSFNGHGVAFSGVLKMALPLGISAYIRSALLTLEHNLIPKSLIRHGENQTEALSSYGYLHGMALPFILYPMTPLTSFSGLLVPEFAEEKGRSNSERMSQIANQALNTTLSYAVCTSMLILLFAREFGYTFYASWEAGKYIAMLAPVIPIMYLDHVADAILKGIGEHIYSMWVNVADAVLSIILVVTLIPIMGIGGYAVVIIVMEVFNFGFSVARLRLRIKFSIRFISAMLLPAISMLVASIISRLAINMSVSGTTAGWLLLRIVFVICSYIATRVAFSILFSKDERKNRKQLIINCK